MGASERSKTQYCRGGEAKPSALSSFRPSFAARQQALRLHTSASHSSLCGSYYGPESSTAARRATTRPSTRGRAGCSTAPPSPRKPPARAHWHRTPRVQETAKAARTSLRRPDLARPRCLSGRLRPARAAAMSLRCEPMHLHAPPPQRCCMAAEVEKRCAQAPHGRGRLWRRGWQAQGRRGQMARAHAAPRREPQADCGPGGACCRLSASPLPASGCAF